MAGPIRTRSLEDLNERQARKRRLSKRRRLLVSPLCDPYHKIYESPEALWIMERKTNKSGEDKKCLKQ